MLKKSLYGLAAALFISGCVQHTETPPEKTPEPVVVEGKRWQLISFGNHEAKVPQKAWIKLDKGRYQGFAGCNGLSGTYTMKGRSIRFTMDPSTLMACPDMRGETEFRKRLLQVDGYSMKEGLFTLERKRKKLLVFMEKEEEADR